MSRQFNVKFSPANPLDMKIWEELENAPNRSAKAKFLMWLGMQAGEEVPVTQTDTKKTSKPLTKTETYNDSNVDPFSDITELELFKDD